MDKKKRIAKWLFVLLSFSFTYFFHGGGFNQNSTIGEIRQFAELGTVELGEWKNITYDVSLFEGGVYSNKNPSMFFFAAPIYAGLFHGARVLGVDTSSRPLQLFFNHFLTFLCAGIWGALLGVLLFYFILRLEPTLKVSDAALLASVACLSTQVFVYSTVAFAHVFESFWIVFTLWRLHLYLEERSFPNSAFLALSCGVALLANQIFVLPIAALYLIFLYKGIQRWRELLISGALMALSLLPLFIYSYLVFGSPLRSNRQYLDPIWMDPKLFMGVFDWPALSRLPRLFIWGRRSLMPIEGFVWLCVFGFVFALRSSRWNLRMLSIFALSVIAVQTLVILSFNGWHGGSAFGPRYFTASIAIMALYSARGYQRFPRLYILWAASCYVIMLIAILGNIFPGEDNPYFLQPAWEALKSGLFIQRAYPSYPGASPIESEYWNWEKYNLGAQAGLRGWWSLLFFLSVQLFILFRMGTIKRLREIFRQ